MGEDFLFRANEITITAQNAQIHGSPYDMASIRSARTEEIPAKRDWMGLVLALVGLLAIVLHGNPANAVWWIREAAGALLMLGGAYMTLRPKVTMYAVFIKTDAEERRSLLTEDASLARQVKEAIETALTQHNWLSSKLIAQTNDGRAAEQMEAILGSSFQQPINCCQTTAIAYALSTLGYATTVDDVLLTCRVNIDSAVGDGMTLAETHDMALRYIRRANLPIFCECYHFDFDSGVTAEHLWAACLMDGSAGSDDVCVLNFHTGIAHNKPKGGGHFALVVGPLEKDREIVMSDVHPIEYGALWQQSVETLFQAIQDKDSCGRSRGMLRFGLTASKELQRPFPSLAACMRSIDWVNPPEGFTTDVLEAYIPRGWDQHMGARNMEGISVVTKALDMLDQTAEWDLDDIMRSLHESYTRHLNTFATPEIVFNVLLRLSNRKIMPAVPTMVPIGKGLDGNALRKLLFDNDLEHRGTTFLISYDYAVATTGEEERQPTNLSNVSEANALAHINKCWSLVAEVSRQADPAIGGLAIAPAHDVIGNGRLWEASLDKMAKALLAVGAGFIIKLRWISDDEELNQNQRIDKLLAVFDADNDGVITPEEIVTGYATEGIELTLEKATSLIAEVDADGNNTLDRSEALSLFAKVLGMHSEDAASQDGFGQVASFLHSFGCQPNDLGFATCHMAIKAHDVRACVRFYNNVLGWPLYKTVDRAHAGTEENAYGSSWASFGAFASFIVFHEEVLPAGAIGHGAWSRYQNCPKVLRDAPQPAPPISMSDTAEMKILLTQRFHEIPGVDDDLAHDGPLTFADIAFPFHGVILEPGFYAKQMARIAEKDPDGRVRWAPLGDVQGLFGGDLIREAIVLRDPDGYPCIFFVCTLEGEAYTKRFPAPPFVYGQYMSVSFPDEPALAAARAKAEEGLRNCPVMSDTGKYVKLGQRKQRDAWLEEFFHNADPLEMHKNYYENVIGWTRCGQTVDASRRTVQLEYEMEGHFLVCRSSGEAYGALSGDDGSHDMGGNKDLVPVPHYGINTGFESYSRMRDAVKVCMEHHKMPRDVGMALSRWGHAPAIDLLNAYNSLFPTDPDTCMSLLCNDPSGNVAEMKWYLDFGEMFHHRGEVGLHGLTIDNSMVEDHFPANALAKLRKRENDTEAK
ncbi:MAG: hypothetical protein HOF19_19405 [Gammaproteobacteria bacterium]|nr:hypothetical protein [Gammaproteobacteria bacterium]